MSYRDLLERSIRCLSNSIPRMLGIVGGIGVRLRDGVEPLRPEVDQFPEGAARDEARKGSG
jgi:hypothetical protein